MISVTMPYYMRQEHLHRSMAAYHRLYHDIDLEFSICDDGSADAVIAHDCKITTLPKKRHALNPCVPINRAVAASGGDIVVITNPEIEHTKPIFQAMLDRLENKNDYVIAACKDHKTGQCLSGSSAKGNMNGRMPMPAGSGFHFCTMMHRSLWRKARGFDEDYRQGQGCDDNDWLWRLEDVGANFIMCDDLVVRHYRTPCRWPTGGLLRNKKLLIKTWGHKWNQS